LQPAGDSLGDATLAAHVVHPATLDLAHFYAYSA
jgi:hypothetical protein